MITLKTRFIRDAENNEMVQFSSDVPRWSFARGLVCGRINGPPRMQSVPGKDLMGAEFEVQLDVEIGQK